MISQGTIKIYNIEKGFGFLKSDSLEEDIFFHITKFEDHQNLDPEFLKRGVKVEFELKKGTKGYFAINCNIIKD